jgi:hypothetical protein
MKRTKSLAGWKVILGHRGAGVHFVVESVKSSGVKPCEWLPVCGGDIDRLSELLCDVLVKIVNYTECYYFSSICQVIV